MVLKRFTSFGRIWKLHIYACALQTHRDKDRSTSINTDECIWEQFQIRTMLEVIERTWPQVVRATGDSLSLPPIPIPRIPHPTIPTLAAISRTQPWESNVLFRPSERYTWVSPVKGSLSTLKMQVGRHADLPVLRLRKTSPVPKFLCLLNLPATNREWSDSSFSLSLPSVYRAQFQILLPRFQTNKQKVYERNT